MPPLEIMDRHQYAVLWPKIGEDRQSEPIVGTPSEIIVRWVEWRHEALDPDGNTIALDVKVVLGLIDVSIGSLMWLGRLVDWANDGTNTLYMVKTSAKGTDLKNRYTRRELGLMRFRNNLPTGD